MSSYSKALLLMVLAGSAVTAAPAHSAILANQVLINGDLKFTIESCTSLACTNGVLVAFGNGFKVQSAIGGAFESGGTTTTPVDTLLKFTVETTDNAFLSGIFVGVDGSSSGNSTGYSLLDPILGVTLAGGSSQASTAGTNVVTTKTFQGRTSVLVKADIGTSSGVLNSSTVTFAVPEPASTALLLTGLLTLGLARRRRSN